MANTIRNDSLINVRNTMEKEGLRFQLFLKKNGTWTFALIGSIHMNTCLRLQHLKTTSTLSQRQTKATKRSNPITYLCVSRNWSIPKWSVRSGTTKHGPSGNIPCWKVDDVDPLPLQNDFSTTTCWLLLECWSSMARVSTPTRTIPARAPP